MMCRTQWLASITFVASLLVSACVVNSQRVEVESRVQVTMSGGQRADFFDVNDPRLVRALLELEAVVGHPVQLAFHWHMLPRPQGEFLDRFFERSIGRAPRDLADLRGRSPQAFAFAAPSLRQISFDHDGSREGTVTRFDPETGVLFVELGASGVLPERGLSGRSSRRSATTSSPASAAARPARWRPRTERSM